MAVTPVRNMRVDGERWAAWEASAAAAGVSITKLVVMTMDNAGHSRAAGTVEIGRLEVSHVALAEDGPEVGGKVVAPAVAVPPRELERRPERKRSRVCPHRIPETSFCRYCDGGGT